MFDVLADHRENLLIQMCLVELQATKQTGYFANTVAGKITEAWVAFFWATFVMYHGRPKSM